MRKSVSALVGVLMLLACDPDPAKQIRIDTASSQQAAPSGVVPPPVALAPWKPENCDLVPDKSGQSSLKVTGPCAFTQRANVECRSLTDDMHVVALRKAKGESTVSVYINVESYKGPGTYKDTQMFVTYQDGTAYYHWGSESVHITVTPDNKSVVLPSNDLIAEPPNTGVLKVSGTLKCGAKLDAAKAVNPKG